MAVALQPAAFLQQKLGWPQDMKQASSAHQPLFSTSSDEDADTTTEVAVPACPEEEGEAAEVAHPQQQRSTGSGGGGRRVLVAKCLTSSDASSGRVILPRLLVQNNLPCVLGYRHYALAVRDCRGRQYEFVIKSWANGSESRRVFCLEGAQDFLRGHGLGVGDAVGICAEPDGALVVEANTPAVRQALLPSSPSYTCAAVRLPPPGAGAAVPLVLGSAARGSCARSVHCTKPAGHPGFCSGPKAAAAAAAGGAAGAAAGRGGRRGKVKVVRASRLREGSLSGGSSPSASLVAASQLQTAASLSGSAGLPPQPELLCGLHTMADVSAGLRLAKVLTSYDLQSKHVVMPAPEVEDGVLNALTEDELALAAVDESQGWQFPTLRAYTNLANRRGFLLEGCRDFLANRGAAPGDTLLLYRRTLASPPRIEVHAARGPSTPRLPSRPDAPVLFADYPTLLHPAGQEAGHAARCASAGCTKRAGHPGFCQAHKGFKRPSLGQLRVPLRSRRAVSDDDTTLSSEGEESDEEFSPAALKRQRRAGTPASRRVGGGRHPGAAALGGGSGCSGSPLAGQPATDPLLSLLVLLGEGEEDLGLDSASMGPQSAAAVAAAATEAEAAAEAAVGVAKQRSGML